MQAGLRARYHITTMQTYLNGNIVDVQTLTEVMEPGYLFGWGVFETLRAYQRRLPFLGEHLARLETGARFLKLTPLSIDYKQIITGLLAGNNLFDAYVRITVYKKRTGIGCIVQVSPFEYYKEEEYIKGAQVIFSDIVRHSQDDFLKVKSLSYVKNRIAWLAAQEQKKEEAIFLNEKGILQEGSRSNIFFVKNNKVFTPALSCGLLEGVTRNVVVNICKMHKIEVIEGEFSREACMRSDEVFVTSSLMEVMPVSVLEDRAFDVKKFTVTARIRAEYKKIISQK